MRMHKPGRCTASIETARQPGWRSRLGFLDHRKNASRIERRAGTSAADPNRADSNELWAEPLDRVMARLGTSVAGLLSSEATGRLALPGPKSPPASRRTPPWIQFLARFRNPLVLIKDAGNDKRRRKRTDRNGRSRRVVQCGLCRHIGRQRHRNARHLPDRAEYISWHSRKKPHRSEES